MGWEAVQNDRLGIGEIQQGLIDLVGGEDGGAIVGFRFLSHAGPHVGVQGMSALGGGFGIGGNDHVAFALARVRARSVISASGSKLGGVATRTFTPAKAQPNIREWATLLPSPM